MFADKLKEADISPFFKEKDDEIYTEIKQPRSQALYIKSSLSYISKRAKDPGI